MKKTPKPKFKLGDAVEIGLGSKEHGNFYWKSGVISFISGYTPPPYGGWRYKVQTDNSRVTFNEGSLRKAPRKKNPAVKRRGNPSWLKLVFLVPNNAYTFLVAGVPTRIDKGYSLFWQTKKEAIAAAKEVGYSTLDGGKTFLSRSEKDVALRAMGDQVAAEYIKRHGKPRMNPAKKHTTANYRNLAREAEKKLQWKRAARYWALALAAYPKSLVGGSYDVDKKNIADNVRQCKNFRPNPLTRRAFIASKAYGRSTAAETMIDKAARYPGEWIHIPNNPVFNKAVRELRHEGYNVQKSEVKNCLYKLKFR